MTTIYGETGLIKVTFDGPVDSTATYVDAPGVKVGDIVLTAITPGGNASNGPINQQTDAVISEDDKIHLNHGSFSASGTYTIILVRV